MDQYPPQTPPGFSPPGYPQQTGYPQQPGQPGYPTQPGAYPPSTPYPEVPGYPQPDGYAQPGYPSALPPGKKRRGGLWVTLLVVVVVLGVVGGVGYFVVLPKIQQISPNSTLQTFCDGYKNMNAQEVYDTLSSSLQATSKESDLETAFGLFKDLGAKIDDCTASNIQVNGSTATATINLTITVSLLGQTQAQTQHDPVSLVLENGTWKISQMQSPSQP
jgi:hypothetical protein